MNIDLAATFKYLNDFAGVMIPLFAIFGILAGVVLLGQVGKTLAYGNGRGASDDGPNFTAIGVKTIIAGCLLQFSTTIMWTRDLLAGAGTGTRAAMALVVTNTSPTWEIILGASFLWLQVIGIAGIFKGFLKWNKAGSGESQSGGDDFFSGLWHILGGAILINIGSS